MALKVELSRPALADIGSIHDFIAHDNPQAALRMVDEIEARCANLAETPDIGAPVGLGLRRIVVGNYLVFYRRAPDKVEIVRVIHGARLIPSELGD